MMPRRAKKQPFFWEDLSRATDLDLAELLQLPEVNCFSTVEEAYQSRYASNWTRKSREIRAALLGYCSYPDCWERAIAVHHCCYEKYAIDDAIGLEIAVPIAGEEIGGVHGFPACKRHHSVEDPEGAHHAQNWFKGETKPPTLDAKNYPEYWLTLRRGWITKRKWVKTLQAHDPETLKQLILALTQGNGKRAKTLLRKTAAA